MGWSFAPYCGNGQHFMLILRQWAGVAPPPDVRPRLSGGGYRVSHSLRSTFPDPRHQLSPFHLPSTHLLDKNLGTLKSLLGSYNMCRSLTGLQYRKTHCVSPSSGLAVQNQYLTGTVLAVQYQRLAEKVLAARCQHLTGIVREGRKFTRTFQKHSITKIPNKCKKSSKNLTRSNTAFSQKLARL